MFKFFQFHEIFHGRSRSLLHYPGLVKPQRPNFSAETHRQKWRNDWNCARQMTPIPVATTPMLGAAFCEQPTWEVWHSEIWKLPFQIGYGYGFVKILKPSSSVASRFLRDLYPKHSRVFWAGKTQCPLHGLGHDLSQDIRTACYCGWTQSWTIWKM